MTKLASIMQQNGWKMEHLNEDIAKNKKSLVEQLRTVADRIEKDAERPVYKSDVSWINEYVERIEAATAELKALKEQQLLLEYIAEE